MGKKFDAKVCALNSKEKARMYWYVRELFLVLDVVQQWKKMAKNNKLEMESKKKCFDVVSRLELMLTESHANY